MLKYKLQQKTSLKLYVFQDCRLTEILLSEIIWSVIYTECPRRNGQNFGRVFLMLNYTDITQNTYIQS